MKIEHLEHLSIIFHYKTIFENYNSMRTYLYELRYLLENFDIEIIFSHHFIPIMVSSSVQTYGF